MGLTLTSRVLSIQGGLIHGFSAAGAPPAPVDPRRIWRLRQVHGAEVHRCEAASSPPLAGDGALSAPGGPGVAVVTADCVPLLLARTGTGAAAAIHAGWRGVAAGVLERGLERLLDSSGERVVAALGPAADGCCYEVGAEVLERLVPPDALVRSTRPGHARLALRELVRSRLLAAGLAERDVEIVGPCTICDPSWPSYRREGEAAGRALSWVFPRGSVYV